MGGCTVCGLPDTIYLFPWLVVSRSVGLREKLECWGTSAITLQRSGVDEWQSGAVGGSQFTFRIDRTEPFACVTSDRNWCKGVLEVRCNGVIAASGGNFCPFGSLPDVGGPWCVSCAGTVRWYGYANPFESLLRPCCPAIGTDVAELFLNGIVLTTPSRFGGDCVCHEQDAFRRIDFSVVSTGCFNLTWTRPLILEALGTTTFWFAYEGLGGGDYNFAHIEGREGADGYQATFRARRGAFGGINIPIGPLTLRSCSPLLADAVGQTSCDGGGVADYRITISE